MNTDIRKQGKESKNKHFHGEPKNPKQKGIKTKIKSKPIQQKNSRQSSISYPNLKKNGERRTGADSDDLMVVDITVLMPIDFSFSMCL